MYLYICYIYSINNIYLFKHYERCISELITTVIILIKDYLNQDNNFSNLRAELLTAIDYPDQTALYVQFSVVHLVQ